jgi:AraC family transcriptional regulator
LGKIAILIAMGMTVKLLAEGSGWRVCNIVCTAGPNDRPFEEQHQSVCIAAVTEGSFQYRSSNGSATLAPGAVLLGNEGTCFECSHEHGVGDRCLSFHYELGYFEDILSSTATARRFEFQVPRLPPSSELAPYLAAAEVAVTNPGALEEIALGFAGLVVTTLCEKKCAPARVNRRDEARIADALRIIDAKIGEPLTLAELAGEAAMSPFHFLRVFRAVVGVTPHRFVLATRLRRAATHLRRSDVSVSDIAYAVGFKDLSEFNRRFRRFMGVAPRVYRRAAGRSGTSF